MRTPNYQRGHHHRQGAFLKLQRRSLTNINDLGGADMANKRA
jgi:hypothetical protein